MSIFKITKLARAGGKVRMAQGYGRCGNEFGAIRELPDWTFADGSPAPPCKQVLKAQRLREAFFARVKRLAALADLAARSQVLPKTPGIKKHRKQDVAFYFDNLISQQENVLHKLQKTKKIIQ